MPFAAVSRLAPLLFAIALLPQACACGEGVGANVGGGNVGGGNFGGGAESAGGGGVRSSLGGGQAGTGGGDASGGGGGSGAVEVCDGVDNDGDGIIDNVDVGGDGVCDCLKIATLGFPGQWGTGDVFTQWLAGKSLQGVVNLGAAELTAEVLAPFQVLIVQDVRLESQGTSGTGHGIGRTFSQAEVAALEAWVKAGGGVATLIGYADSSEVANVNTLLAPFGLSYGTTPILPGGGGQTVAVTHWLAGHTVSDGITQVGVDNGYAVLGGGTVIAWQPDQGQYDVGRALEVSKGHVFVWGDEWITYDSEWTNHPDYQVARFWLNLLKYLSPADFCQVAIPPGIG